MANDYANMVLDSMAIALYNKFGSKYSYFKEGAEQNATTPYFVVSPQAPSFIARSFYKYDEILPVVVYCFQDDPDPELKSTQIEIAESLWECLEYINLDNGDGLLRGYDVSWNVVEGVLQFFITYRFELHRVTTNDFMETLNQKTFAKG